MQLPHCHRNGDVIISYRHNFIFIRTRKTASSTIEAVLTPCLRPKDIYVEGVHFRGGDQSPYPGFERGIQHMTAAQMKTLVSPEFWNNCFRFTAERHPYEKAVSLAYYRCGRSVEKNRPNVPFEHMLDKVIRAGNYGSYKYYTIAGQLAAHDFIRHETLKSDLERIGTKFGIEIPSELPRKKGNYRKDPRPAREILSEQQKRTVYETCREEFELLAYAP